MRKYVILAALALAISAHGQVSNPSIITVASDPTGVACTGGLPNEQYNGTMFTCKGGAWTASGSSTNYHILAASGDTTGATDTAALQALVNTANTTVLLDSGSYYISGVTIAQPGVNIIGGGGGSTTLYETSATAFMFTYTYKVTWQPATTNLSSTLRGFSILPYTGVTQTAGGAISLNNPTAGTYLIGLHVEDVTMSGLWGGLNIAGYQASNWFNNMYCMNMLSGGTGCIYYNGNIGGGDDHFSNFEGTGFNSGVQLVQSDTIEFTNLKLNGSGISFIGAGTNYYRIRLINPNIESYAGGVTCGIDFGSHDANIFQFQMIGGGIGLMANAMCNYTATNMTTNKWFIDFNDYTTSGLGRTAYGPLFKYQDIFLNSSSASMQLQIANNLYPLLVAKDDTGTVKSQWINDPLGGHGSMYFDYTGTAGGSIGSVNFRNQVSGGTTVLSLDKDGLMYHNTFTVATLPACAAATVNAETMVTDATAFTFGSAPTGGSNIHVPVYCQASGAGPTYAWIMY